MLLRRVDFPNFCEPCPTMLAALLLMFIGQAFGGERMSCEAQPMPDGREWHYRIQVDGRGERCYYVGKRWKLRDELYWDTHTTRLSAPPSEAVEHKDAHDAVEPEDATVLEPHPDGNFAERWRALDGR